MLKEAECSRPRPKPRPRARGRGQKLEDKAKAEAKCWSMKLNYSQKDHINFYAFTGYSTLCLETRHPILALWRYFRQILTDFQNRFTASFFETQCISELSVCASVRDHLLSSWIRYLIHVSK